ncbi:MAG: dihydrofolate reductase family protein [Thermoleophilia bacterium]|nr:dihydrofolate reductase family protein [Thermoleophilia bacterium]
MSELIVTEFVTLDGVMEAPGGEPSHPHSGWVGPYMESDPKVGPYKLDEVLEAEAHLLGRVTYESFAGAWPQREGEFADKVNAMPKYVVTSTLDELEWNNSTPLRGEVVSEVEKLKAGEGGPILVAGSRTLVHTLLRNDLIDVLRLMIFPVVLGSGDRVWPDDNPEMATLKLAKTNTTPSGVQVNVFRRA